MTVADVRRRWKWSKEVDQREMTIEGTADGRSWGMAAGGQKDYGVSVDDNDT